MLSCFLEEGDLSEDADEGDFDIADIWRITFDRLESLKAHLPNLYAAYIRAKESGFEEWAGCPEGKVISHDTVCELANSYSDRDDDVLDDCHKDVLEWAKECNDLHSLENFELPEDFLQLQTKGNF